jgi:hypothetical protein
MYGLRSAVSLYTCRMVVISVSLVVRTIPATALTPAEEAKAIQAAREFIKDRLKAPATAQFSMETICAGAGAADFEEAKGTGSTPECKPAQFEEGKLTAIYRGSVDSQNSVGAVIRTKFFLNLGLKDGRIAINDAMDAVRLLYSTCKQSNESSVLLGNRSKLTSCDTEFPSAKQ